MNKTNIEWTDYTWNPVTGCLHNCPYCYARRITNRFKGGGYGKEKGMFISKYRDDAFKPPYVLDEPQLSETKEGWYRTASFPYGFEPTFHKYRLNEPRQVNKPSKIFVVSMGDLFGDWVPDEWINQVFEACKKAPQHKYLFLTKNPERYINISDNSSNFWFGATATNNKMLDGAVYAFMERSSNHGEIFNTFVSIEPIEEEIKIDKYDGYFACLDWVIVGAETGNRKSKVVPKKEWIDNLAIRCKQFKIPIFMKDSLIPIMGEDFIQEYPTGMEV